MRKSQGWTGLRTAVVALGLLASQAGGLKAAAISNVLTYGTAGAIDNSGITGANVISYVPIASASIDPTSNIPLGSFQVAALSAGQTTSYNNTPFSLTFLPSSLDGSPLTVNSPVTVTGTLTGQVTGSYQSSVQVHFNPVVNGSFQLAGASSTLSMLSNDQKLLVPSSAGGTTTLEGIITTVGNPNPEAPVPEPSTIALFLSTVCGLGLRKYVLSRRQRTVA